jgi:glutamine phosphoribosylpyrophosphate amidotransferase
VDLLLPVRDPRRVQPLRRGLDGRRAKESAALAEELIAETCRGRAIEPGQLTLHADRGSSMTSRTVREAAATSA